MSVILYNIFLFFFKVVTHIAALFNVKAKKWVRGRKNIFEKLRKAIPSDTKVIWFHCASLGEFEQGKPIIEKLKAQNSSHKILLTFFSPSGYEAQKDFKGADWIFYLPLDGPANARRFMMDPLVDLTGRLAPKSAASNIAAALAGLPKA